MLSTKNLVNELMHLIDTAKFSDEFNIVPNGQSIVKYLMLRADFLIVPIIVVN